MLISLDRPQINKPQTIPSLIGAKPRHRAAHPIVQTLDQMKTTTATILRAIVMILVLATCYWVNSPEKHSQVLLVITLVSALLALLSVSTRRIAPWVALGIDFLTILLLLYITGGAASMFLPLTLILIFQGALIGGYRDALAGGVLGLIILLLEVLLEGHAPGNAFLLTLLLLIVASAGMAWLCHMGLPVLHLIHDSITHAAHATHEQSHTQQVSTWQRASLKLCECASLADLARQTSAQASLITGVPVTVEFSNTGTLPQQTAGLRSFTIPLHNGGRILVHGLRGDLTMIQRDALTHLATMVETCATSLQAGAMMERHQTALTALWECGGILRAAPNLHAAAYDTCQRMAMALDLEWLALLAPDGAQPLGTLAMAGGRQGGTPPRLHGAQIRVSIEAMRCGSPLVREEGNATLACLPLQIEGDTPLVLVAYGNAGDEATQTLLMVFGDQLVQRLVADIR